LIYVIDRLFQRLLPSTRLYFYELMVQPILERPLLTAGLSKPFEFKEIVRGQPEIAAMPARENIKDSRFRQGARCLGVYKRDQLVGYLWFRFGSYEEDEVRCDYELVPHDRSVFDFDLFIFPEHRMGLAFVATWHGANAFLRDHGVQYTFSRLTRFNLPSRRAHSHIGWKRVGSAIFFQAGRLEVMVSTLRPFLHLSFSRWKRVRLRLSADTVRQ
jgi:hypothetical protein